MSIKIGILSDTHGFLDDKVFYYFKSCDQIWHAGDIGDALLISRLSAYKPLKAVYGNIDGREVRLLCQENLYFEVGGLRVGIIHIAGIPPNITSNVRGFLKNKPLDILVYGHTHILHIARHRSVLHINPGAAGYSGIHTSRTLVRFEIKDGDVCNLEIIDLGDF